MNGIETASRFGFRNQKHSLDIAHVLENIKALQTEQGLEFEIHTTEYKSTLKPALLQKQEGWLRWVIDPKSQKILGAASMGEHAADVLIPVVVALRAHMTLKEFQEVNVAHPTLTEVLGK